MNVADRPARKSGFKAGVDRRYAELMYDGLWFSPLRRALDAFIAPTQDPICGTVVVRLHKGTATCRQRQSPYALYHPSVSSHELGDRFDHAAAAGFSYVWSMPLRVGNLVAEDGTDHVAGELRYQPR